MVQKPIGNPQVKPTVAIDRKVRDRLKLQAALSQENMSEIAETAITRYLDSLGTPKLKTKKGS